LVEVRGPFFQGDETWCGCNLAGSVHVVQRMAYVILKARIRPGDFLGGVFGRGQRGPFFQGDEGRRGCRLADRIYVLRRVGYAILEARV